MLTLAIVLPLKIINKKILKNFLKEKINEEKSEFLIPSVVDELVSENKASVKILTSPCTWFGVTYKEDKPFVVESIKELIKKGIYKEGLY